MAVSCCVAPNAMDGSTGVSVTEVNAGAVTVSVAVPLIAPEVALIVVEPCPTLVARPWLPAALLIVATLAMLDAQVTEPVRFCVLPLVNVPVAANCCVEPSVIEGLDGVTATDTRVGAVIVNVAELEIAPEVAVMVVEPWLRLDARPVVPAALLIVATVGALEDHVTDEVTS